MLSPLVVDALDIKTETPGYYILPPLRKETTDSPPAEIIQPTCPKQREYHSHRNTPDTLAKSNRNLAVICIGNKHSKRNVRAEPHCETPTNDNRHPH